jgi:hypothetical protein
MNQSIEHEDLGGVGVYCFNIITDSSPCKNEPRAPDTLALEPPPVPAANTWMVWDPGVSDAVCEKDQ